MRGAALASGSASCGHSGCRLISGWCEVRAVCWLCWCYCVLVLPRRQHVRWLLLLCCASSCSLLVLPPLPVCETVVASAVAQVWRSVRPDLDGSTLMLLKTQHVYRIQHWIAPHESRAHDATPD